MIAIKRRGGLFLPGAQERSSYALSIGGDGFYYGGMGEVLLADREMGQ
ncbi:MAG: hypothetical protein JST42_02500 [Bacteroidetes bacterium]|nr:hypothetical protein [Bacteroidota bacterium]